MTLKRVYSKWSVPVRPLGVSPLEERAVESTLITPAVLRKYGSKLVIIDENSRALEHCGEDIPLVYLQQCRPRQNRTNNTSPAVLAMYGVEAVVPETKTTPEPPKRKPTKKVEEPTTTVTATTGETVTTTTTTGETTTTTTEPEAVSVELTGEMTGVGSVTLTDLNTGKVTAVSSEEAPELKPKAKRKSTRKPKKEAKPEEDLDPFSE